MTEVSLPLHNGHGLAVSPLPHGTRPGQPRPVCQCCPYGYHIDLDFVRFCEVMERDSGEPSPGKRQRRERRRQRQSMEVLLGLTSPVIWNIEQLLPPVIHETLQVSDVPLPPIRSSSLSRGNDGLKKAVMDFEATLERTTKRRSTDAFDAVSPRMCRSLGSKAELNAIPSGHPTPQELSAFIDFDMMSICSVGSGLSAGPLQNIREQMAMSLERMKELEDRVKLIPALQSEMIQLKDEKTRLFRECETLRSSLRTAERNVEQVKKPLTREVGVLSTVLTREVGVTPSLRKFKAATTETMKVLTQTTGTATDLTMKELDKEERREERKAKRLSLKDLDTIVEVPQEVEKFNKSVQVAIREPVTVLKVIEKRETGVQAEPPGKQVRDFGVTARPRGVDIATEMRPKTRDTAVSDDKTTDLLCDKCKNVKTKTIGVGYGNVNVPEVPPKLGLQNLGLPNRSKSFDFSNPKPKLTRNVAVGTVTPIKKLTASKNIDTNDFLASRSRHVGMNTNKMKLVDAGTGHENGVNDWAPCERCKARAKTPTTLRERDSAVPSKIPRPKSAATTPVMERKKFHRQDTYTKMDLSLLQGPSDSKHGKERLKSFDKLDTHTEEKVEVTLRKKTRPLSVDQSLSEVEQRLSKDLSLKDGQFGESFDRFSGNFDCSFDYDEHYDDSESKRNSSVFPENAMFQPIQDKLREKLKPSKEMKAAMKVVNDSLNKYPNGLPRQLKNASNIIQQEWFKISSTVSANPLDVEDYLDSFEEVSSTLLEFIVNMTDNNGNTAMHYAVSHGNFDVVSILLDSKVCNINKANAAGYTCVMLVSLAQVRSETHRQVVKRLFQLADVNIRAKQHGQTALMLAVSHGRLDMVQLLLEAGADTNIQDGDGSTALMCAAEHGHLEIVKHILAHPDCDPSIVDCDGSSALAIAMEAGNRDIGVLLYAREHFGSSSRGSSPYTSMKQRRSKASSSPSHCRTPTSPGPNRRSDHSV